VTARYLFALKLTANRNKVAVKLPCWVDAGMWNSSRRIALTSTAMVLVFSGILGFAWLADWLPIEFQEPESGQIAADPDLDNLHWVVPADTGEAQDAVVFSGQSEPGEPEFFESRSSSRTGFADRDEWRTDAGLTAGGPSEHGRRRDSDASPSIPDQFPSIARQHPPGTDTIATANGTVQSFRSDRDSGRNEPRMATPHQVVSVADYQTESSDGENGRGGIQLTSGTSEPSGEKRSRLFASDAAPTLRQARGFPREVAFLDQGRETEPLQGNPGSTSEPEPAFDSSSDSGSDSAAAPRLAARPSEAASAAPKPASGSVDLKQIDAWIEEARYVEAQRALSEIYWSHPEQRPAIRDRIEQNARTIYFSPQPHFLEPYVVQPGDLLQNIAPKYQISWRYLAELNRSDPRRIRAGQKLKVIKGPFSAFVSLSEFELTIHCHGFFVKRYQVGTGRDGATPIGKFQVLDTIVAPQYTDPDGRVIAGGDPTNPLGTHWIDLGDSYGIHGTIEPNSIGKSESRGCVRMRNEEVAEVFALLIKGSEVVIRP